MIFILAYGAIFLTFLAAAPTVWTYLLVQLYRREPVVPRQPRRAVPWGLIDLLLGFVLLVVLSAIGMKLFPLQSAGKPPPVAAAAEGETATETPKRTAEEKSDKPLDRLTLRDARQWIALDTGVKLVVAILLIAAIALRLRPSAADWGWTLAHWRRDLLLGCGTFLATFAPMIGLQATLVYVLEWKYEHPMIDLVTRTKDPLLFALTAVAAAVAAPLFEEFIFRGLLQGWLEKLVSGKSGPQSILLGREEEPAAMVPSDVPEYSPASVEPIDLSPYASPQPDDSPAPAADGTVPATQHDWLAIFFSMLVFSLLHFTHGPAWIPLLIFGAAVGFVYQRTHRLWPGIIAHMLLNATTIFGLWIQVFVGIPK
jgi:membrane protease YdiL (CAAX protease family)